jgi:hypothetical protein
MLSRRDFAILSGLSAFADLGRAAATVRPNWLGFGLNRPELGEERFPLTLGVMKAPQTASAPPFQIEVNRAIASQFRSAGDFVGEAATNAIGGEPMLAAVLDYENVLQARLGSASFVVLHLVGHGVLLDFDRGRGWSMRSSFPFPVTLLRESQVGSASTEVKRYVREAYLAPQQSFVTSFVQTAKRLSSNWHDSGAGRGFNVRVMSSSIHPDAGAKLNAWSIGRNIHANWMGHLVSAALCEALDIPVVPYAENTALGSFTYTFDDRLVAQNVRLPEEADIDLKVHVTLRNVGREIKFRSQLQRWEVVRMVVFDVRVVDDRNEELVSTRMGFQDDLPDTLAREDDNSPARDAHFFDMAIYRGLVAFFRAIDRDDKAALSRLYVKVDATQQAAYGRLRTKYRQAFGRPV